MQSSSYRISGRRAWTPRPIFVIEFYTTWKSLHRRNVFRCSLRLQNRPRLDYRFPEEPERSCSSAEVTREKGSSGMGYTTNSYFPKTAVMLQSPRIGLAPEEAAERYTYFWWHGNKKQITVFWVQRCGFRVCQFNWVSGKEEFRSCTTDSSVIWGLWNFRQMDAASGTYLWITYYSGNNNLEEMIFRTVSLLEDIGLQVLSGFGMWSRTIISHPIQVAWCFCDSTFVLDNGWFQSLCTV